jgi:hypothetical protein
MRHKKIKSTSVIRITNHLQGNYYYQSILETKNCSEDNQQQEESVDFHQVREQLGANFSFSKNHSTYKNAL